MRYYSEETATDTATISLIMPLYQAIILAIVQGLTEFLPISSTAHLAVIPKLMGWTDQGLGFDIALHVGTLAAVLVFFFKDWVAIVSNAFGIKTSWGREDENNRNLLWYLVAGSIPVGIAGLFLKKYAEGPWRNFYVIGAMLIIIGVVMAVADLHRQRSQNHDQHELERCVVGGPFASTWRLCPALRGAASPSRRAGSAR